MSGCAISALYVLISNAVEIAQQIAEKIKNGEVELDVTAITAMIEKQAPDIEAQQIDIATIVLLVSWLLGVVGYYRVGKIQDKDAISRKT